ncbi:hypothetical protein CFC21_027609, partial [Triticum aestivum]
MAAPRALVLAVLLVIAIANAEATSVVIGLAKCADCTRKNMKAGEAFKGLQVAIKCKNVDGEYESKAVGSLDGIGAFSVPLASDLHGADCVAQLHSAVPRPGAIQDRAGVRGHHLRCHRRRQHRHAIRGVARVCVHDPVRADQAAHHRALPPQEAGATEAGAQAPASPGLPPRAQAGAEAAAPPRLPPRPSHAHLRRRRWRWIPRTPL